MTKTEFLIKIGINSACFLAIVCYLVVRTIFRRGYVYSILSQERHLVLDENLDINDLQNNSWAKNLDEVTSFSSISIAIVLIVVAYLTNTDLPYYKELYFKIILFVVSISAISYTLSIQLYNNAISKMPSKTWTLKQRKIAVTLQVVGWYALTAGLLFCIMLVDTYLGAICNLYAVVGVMTTYQIKLPECS